MAQSHPQFHIYMVDFMVIVNKNGFVENYLEDLLKTAGWLII